LDELVGEVAQRAEGWDTALVVNGEGILLGRLFKEELEGDPNARVEAVMQHGPSTFRPDVDVVYMAKFMHDNELETAPVTTSDGVFIGMALREDLEKVVNELSPERGGET
jgi:Mg/Co/Ni transporter MgtE